MEADSPEGRGNCVAVGVAERLVGVGIELAVHVLPRLPVESRGRDGLALDVLCAKALSLLAVRLGGGADDSGNAGTLNAEEACPG